MVLHGGFRKKVNFALLLIDSYTDEIIRNGVSVSAYSGLCRPIRKNDGYFVFANLEAIDSIELDIQSEKYEQQRLAIRLSAINSANPIVKHKLTQKKSYLPRNITAITGKCKPTDKIVIIYENNVNVYKLLHDVKQGQNYIHIYNPANKDLEGDEFAIVDKQGEILEIISLCLKKENEIYETVLFSKDYKKSEHSLVRVGIAALGQDGKYFYPIRYFDEKNKTVKIVKNGNVKTLRSVQIEKGSISTKNF